MGLRQILDVSGAGAVSWNYVGEHLRDRYIRNSEEMSRVAEARKRDHYYDGGGDEYIKQLIFRAFEDALTRKLRADLVAWSKWNNVLRRVTGELATVYSEPAKRSIPGDAENKRYQDLVELCNLDAVMREVDAMLGRHAECWVQYRVREGSKEPVVEVISPAAFWAVHDPRDPARLVAIILDQTPANAGALTPCYRVVLADETFQLDKECRVIPSSYAPMPLNRMPGVLAALVPPSAKGKLLSQNPAADLVAAHETIWFQNVLLLKESKSANKQTYLTGDTSSAVMNQSADTEREAMLPEGVTASAIDRGMDLAQFRENADHVLERAGANHGLPPSVLHHRDASSGAEIHLRRIPLRELRRKRVPVMRRVEREIAQIQSAINAGNLPEYSFDATGWGIDFGEIQQPLTESEADSVFEERRRLGLTNTWEEIKRRNPDLKTDEAADEVLSKNIVVETKRIAKMRPLMQMSGAAGSSADDMDRNGRAIATGEEQPEDEEPAA